jgi:radical SAM superfamily enzyme YgiQ (UPF0313 family)
MNKGKEDAIMVRSIQFTSGCPNNCKYCYEPKEQIFYDPIIPEGETDIDILDMNLLSNPKCEEILVNLMEARNKNYNLVCGIDYRILTQDIANLLHNARIRKIRWAWDYSFLEQKKHKETLQKLTIAG